MVFNPKVSIVIPVFNGSDYLREAIESALAQTYRNIEIVVINDGSQDDGETERIALSYGDSIQYFAQKNGGVGSALNVATEKMTGDYFSWLSHDDLYCPEKVEAQVRALAGMDRTRSILYGDYAIFFDNAADVRETHLPTVPPDQFRYFITTNNILHGCTLLIPKAAFDECGGFNEALRTTQDYDLWFRMAKKFQFIHIPGVQVKARSHAEQGSVKMKDTALREINALLSGFVRNLTKAELAAATHSSLSLAYAAIAANLMNRGFSDAAKAASDLAWKNIWRSSVADAIQCLAVLRQARVVGTPVGWARGILSKLRFKVRQCLK
jgi:glycosyltransferase involved in cell wall biosynthesis